VLLVVVVVVVVISYRIKVSKRYELMSKVGHGSSLSIS